MRIRMLMLMFLLPLSVCGAEAFSSESFRRSGTKINLTAMVKDACGDPVSNANVIFLFNTGRGRSAIMRKTDSNGLASAEGRANLYTILRVSKDHFYQSDTTLRFSNLNNEQVIMEEITQWERKPITLILKEKRNPCIRQRHVVSLHNIPTNVWMVLDLDGEKVQLEGQVGLGFEMRVCNKKDTLLRNGERTILELRSVGEATGFLINDDLTQSRFRFPYEAPICGYKKTLYIGNPAQKPNERDTQTLGDDNEGKQLVFRLQNSGQKNAVSYRYGLFVKLVPLFDMNSQTASIHAIYYVNPEDNDRNTEYQYP